MGSSSAWRTLPQRRWVGRPSGWTIPNFSLFTWTTFGLDYPKFLFVYSPNRLGAGWSVTRCRMRNQMPPSLRSLLHQFRSRCRMPRRMHGKVLSKQTKKIEALPQDSPMLFSCFESATLLFSFLCWTVHRVYSDFGLWWYLEGCLLPLNGFVVAPRGTFPKYMLMRSEQTGGRGKYLPLRANQFCTGSSPRWGGISIEIVLIVRFWNSDVFSEIVPWCLLYPQFE